MFFNIIKKCFVMRFFLFVVTNVMVVLLFGVFMFFLDIQFSNLINLLIISGIVGFFGSVISLFLSKYIALFFINGNLLEIATNGMEAWLLEVIYSQSKQLKIVMPQVVIYDSSDMNAFATGFGKNSSLIAISTGLLKAMNNDEIEAVVAHEMSHISNGDMVTMTLIQGIINTFVIFISRLLAQCVISFSSFFCSSFLGEEVESSDDYYTVTDLENNSSIYFFISMIFELVFGILANLIILWFSRYREFYADAGSAKLVGCNKMISALEKLKLSYEPQGSNAILFFCINGYKKQRGSVFNNLFMSHPSLDDRISALRCGHYLNKSSLFYNSE